MELLADEGIWSAPHAALHLSTLGLAGSAVPTPLPRVQPLEPGARGRRARTLRAEAPGKLPAWHPHAKRARP